MSTETANFQGLIRNSLDMKGTRTKDLPQFTSYKQEYEQQIEHKPPVIAPPKSDPKPLVVKPALKGMRPKM